MAWSNCANHLRFALKCVGVAVAALLSLLFFHQFVLPLVAYTFPNLDATLFDLGVFGAYPTQHYVSFDLPGPQARQLRWDQRCDHGLVLLTPNGASIERPGPMILDSQGDLVWRSDAFGPTANLKVQRYNGEDYLTFWSGEKAATSGKGLYYMVDSSYEVARMVHAVGDNLFGDLHEFRITESGTALMTVYNTTMANLTAMGMGRGENGWIVDNMFQEIDLDTGELIFQWRASDHFDPTQTFMTNPFGGYWESDPFDWYHINSIVKDSQGNYLISSRHFHSVTCISPTGQVLWILGGRDNQFKDLSDGKATDFKWQHDARWVSEDENLLTLFDNGKAGDLHADASESRALFIQLDVEQRTAKLVHELGSLHGILASSQGSVQRLPDDDQIFVGWGSAAAYSEYTKEGEMLCETHLAAAWSFWYERFKSYRTTKVFDWHGTPTEAPKAKIEGGSLFVSWNGATDVAFWSLEICRGEEPQTAKDLRRVEKEALVEIASRDDAFDQIDVIPKIGFEGSFTLPSIPAFERPFTRYRVAAMNSKHEVLRYSEVIPHSETSSESSTLMILVKLFLAVGIVVGARFVFRYYRSRQSWVNAQQRSVLAPPAWMEWKPPQPWKRSDRSRVYEWVSKKWTSMYPRPR